MTLGSGIAVFGIWGAVAVCAVEDGLVAILVALFATIATGLVVA